MAFSQTQLDALDTAISQGALTLSMNGRTVTYRSLTEMIQLRDTMRAELGIAVNARAKARFITPVTGKGL